MLDNILSAPNYKTNVGLGGSKREGEIHGVGRYSKAKNNKILRIVGRLEGKLDRNDR